MRVRATARARALAALAIVLAGLASWPGPARTQSAAAPGADDGWDQALAVSLSGDWSLAISEDAARASIEAGIAAATAGLPPLVDGVAAGRLRERLTLSPRITLAVTRERIQTRFAHATYDTAPGFPSSVPVPGDPSATMEIVQFVRSGRLEQIFTTDGGRRWSTFTPSADGTRLTLDAVIHSERLSADVRFRIPYRRAG